MRICKKSREEASMRENKNAVIKTACGIIMLNRCGVPVTNKPEVQATIYFSVRAPN